MDEGSEPKSPWIIAWNIITYILILGFIVFFTNNFNRKHHNEILLIGSSSKISF